MTDQTFPTSQDLSNNQCLRRDIIFRPKLGHNFDFKISGSVGYEVMSRKLILKVLHSFHGRYGCNIAKFEANLTALNDLDDLDMVVTSSHRLTTWLTQLHPSIQVSHTQDTKLVRLVPIRSLISVSHCLKKKEDNLYNR